MTGAIVRTIFLRFYAASLNRPWIKSPRAAFNDARYRLSVPLAAPFVAASGVAVVELRRFAPMMLSHRTRCVLICGSLVLAGVVVFIVLGRIFCEYLETPELVLSFNEPVSLIEIGVQVVLWICVVSYCVIMMFV